MNENDPAENLDDKQPKPRSPRSIRFFDSEWARPLASTSPACTKAFEIGLIRAGPLSPAVHESPGRAYQVAQVRRL